MEHSKSSYLETLESDNICPFDSINGTNGSLSNWLIVSILITVFCILVYDSVNEHALNTLPHFQLILDLSSSLVSWETKGEQHLGNYCLSILLSTIK